jgi:hypothetical protein
MVLNKKNPELDEYQVLDSLRKSGLNETANYLHALLLTTTNLVSFYFLKMQYRL